MIRSPYKYFLLTLLVILIDQGVKMLVHFRMEEGFSGQIVVFDEDSKSWVPDFKVSLGDLMMNGSKPSAALLKLAGL